MSHFREGTKPKERNFRAPSAQIRKRYVYLSRQRIFVMNVAISINGINVTIYINDINGKCTCRSYGAWRLPFIFDLTISNKSYDIVFLIFFSGLEQERHFKLSGNIRASKLVLTPSVHIFTAPPPSNFGQGRFGPHFLRRSFWDGPTPLLKKHHFCKSAHFLAAIFLQFAQSIIT